MISSNNGAASQRSNASDGVTSSGKELKKRERVVTPRPPQLSKPMAPFRRHHFESQNYLPRPLWNLVHSIVESPCCANRYNNVENHYNYNMQQQRRQYTLEWKLPQKSSFPCLHLRQRLCWLCSRTTSLHNTISDESDPSYCLGMNVNNIISTYISWTYQTSYLLLFFAFGICYFGLIVFFAVLYLWVAMENSECITSGGVPIGSTTSVIDGTLLRGQKRGLFSDCFHLSWTTFSTVGYGLIYPATGAEEFEVAHACVGLGVLGSFEAFLGVLYAGFCGAILFGKVLRSQNIAQVFFSDPIVIRYGKEELGGGGLGVVVGGGDDGRRILEEEEEEEQESWDVDEEDNNIPCPSLEFRLVNRLHDVTNGEIVEAKLHCVAILDPKLCHEDVLDSVNLDSTPPLENPENNNNTNDNHESHVKINEQTTISELAKVLEQDESSSNINTLRRGVAFHSSDSKQPRIFVKLNLDTEEHPFFRRVWFGRHRLDEHSPLLTQHARDRVKQCGGYWPSDMNNYKSIKTSLHFRHLLVCIKGTSNANARSVHAQKVYDLVDVNVGYRFIPMNYHAASGEIKTDGYLLNAVYEQRGGGAEPFS